jgi:hypothetical protein
MKIITPPEGPANSAIENDDGSITRLGGASLPNAVAGKRDNMNRAPIDNPPEPAEPLDDPSDPAPGVKGLTPVQDPSMTPEEKEQERKDAEERLRQAQEQGRNPAFAGTPETDEQRIMRLRQGHQQPGAFGAPSDEDLRRPPNIQGSSMRVGEGGAPSSLPQPANPEASPPGEDEANRRV